MWFWDLLGSAIGYWLMFCAGVYALQLALEFIVIPLVHGVLLVAVHVVDFVRGAASHFSASK